MEDPSPLPEADIDGFVDWVENEYPDERWSHSNVTDSSVTIWSGRYPSFLTFQDDLRPRLHKHGLVIEATNTNISRKIDGEMHNVHWISAIPIARVAAPALDMECKRNACTAIIADANSEYCEECLSVMARI